MSDSSIKDLNSELMAEAVANAEARRNSFSEISDEEADEVLGGISFYPKPSPIPFPKPNPFPCTPDFCIVGIIAVPDPDIPAPELPLPQPELL